MNMRNIVWIVTLSVALAASACGSAPSDAVEQSGAVLTSSLPVALKLTTISMNGNSVNPDVPVHVYVTLPGLSTTSTFIGDYSGKTVVNQSLQFNCSSVHALPDSTGYCKTNLPLFTTVGPTRFTGNYPAGTNSATASVQINGTRTSFTIDSQGRSSKTCATAWMTINNLIDGDKLTICWETGLVVPVTAPPMIETIFYPGPGELSQTGLQHMNTISTKNDVSYQESGSVGGKVSGEFEGDNEVSFGPTFSGSQTTGWATTITSGSATSFMVPSKQLLQNWDDSLYYMMVGAHATWTNWHNGNPPEMITDLSTGTFIWCTLGSLKGLAQTPPVVSQEIQAGNAPVFLMYITPDVAQKFIAQHPSPWGQSIEAAVLANPKRFVPTTPAHMTLTHSFIDQEQLINATQTDMYVGQSTGVTFSLDLFLEFGLGTTETLTTTYSNVNQSTATVTLQTNDPCVEGTVDLYMDTAFGTIVPVAHLEDSCNAPNNICTGGQPSTFHTLLPGQSLLKGQVMTSCNGLWSLSIESDGRLVERYVPDNSTPTVFWTPGGTVATMQATGDFVVTDASGNVLTDSGTSSSGNAYFILQDNGFLAIYNPIPTPETGSGGALPPLWTLGPGG